MDLTSGNANLDSTINAAVMDTETKREHAFLHTYNQNQAKLNPVTSFDLNLGKIHECEICSRRFSRKSFLKTHYVTHTGIKAFKCPECDIRFTLKASMKRHLKTTHSEEKLYKCHQCDKSYSQQYSLACHLKTHSSDNPYRCPKCGKGMSGATALERHIKKHDLIHKCGKCELVFQTRIELRKHASKHSIKQKFTCDECGKFFTKSENLVSHMEEHSGEKVHMCDSCGQCFSALNHLNRHVSKVHQKRQTCKNKRLHIDADEGMILDAYGHFRSTPPEKGKEETTQILFLCAVCGMCFIREDHLRQHVRDLGHIIVSEEDVHETENSKEVANQALNI